MQKPFIYLVLSRSEYPYFEDLVSRDSDCIVLYWKPHDQRPEQVLRAEHPDWNDYLLLFADGQFKRPHGDLGTYELQPENRLVLNWKDSSPDILLWDKSGRCFLDPSKPFSLCPLAEQDMPWDRVDMVPNTWSTGRNRLLCEALKRGEYEYFIFMDDDVILSLQKETPEQNPFRFFEEFLQRERPAVGYGNYGWHEREGTGQAMTSLAAYDACFNALHRDTLPILLPYYEDFDHQSWWWSHEILFRISSLIYPGAAVQNNALKVRNLISDPYPCGEMSDLIVPHNFFRKSIANRSVRREYNRHCYPENRLIEYPLQLGGDYRRSQTELGEVFKLSHPYWQEKKVFWESQTGHWLNDS